MYPILGRFDELTLHTYGFLLAIGFLLAVFLARREAHRTGMDPSLILDLSVNLLVAALLGSRLFYVLGNWQEFAANPVEAIKFWRGGLVFYGGLICAFPIGVWYVRKHRLNFSKLADVIAPSIAIGQALGRLGCFSAGCCYGKPTTGFFSVTFRDANSLAPLGIPLHPTQLYESAATFGIFLALIAMRRAKRFQGQLLWYYLLFYSVARFTIEFYRGDPRGWAIPGVLSTAQAIGIPVALFALLMILRRPSPPDPVKEKTPES
jgi:phosphatidylglycerol:prolipoprotein diacylglycerol transferase